MKNFNSSVHFKFGFNIALVVLGVLGLSLTLLVKLPRVQAAGTITGTVYSDFNQNGTRNTTAVAPNYAVDAGIGSVTVTAYDSAGVNRGSTTTCVSAGVPSAFCTASNVGAYSLSASGTGPYRVEFTNLPAGYQPGAFGTNNGTTVRFVNDGATANVDLGIVEPAEYCQNVPTLAINSYSIGSSGSDTIFRFPYSYSDELDGRLNSVDPTAWTTAPSRLTNLNPTGIAGVNPVGATFGLAWNNITDRLYAASYLKRGARFGSLSSESTGAIYTTSTPTGTPATTLFVDLNAVFGAGTAGANPHVAASTPDWTVDTATITLVGKRGLGGLKLSKDGSTLYTVNLADKRLYVIPTSGTLDNTTITRFDIPTTGLTTGGGICATADVRPFALGRDRSGWIYVGAVCSAESEANDAKLHAFVWRFNGSTFTLVANNNLTFNRTIDASETKFWQRWADTTGVLNRAAPVLTDIEFDGANMILGIRDRYGDQVVTPDYFRGYGDIMRACASGSNFTFESNGSCGGVTAGGAGTNEGNGGGEYYNDLNGDDARLEGGLGGLVQVPGFNHVITTFYDAVSYNSAGTLVNNFYTSGIQRYSNTTGQMTGAYDIYLEADTGNFGKADGVGDSEVLCSAAPLEIGNRVWNDADGDGVQDANESGINNVTVHLFSGSTSIGTAVTNSSGEYYFVSSTAPDPNITDNTGQVNAGGGIQRNTTYQIRFDLAANYSGAGALTGLNLTSANSTFQAGDDDANDSDFANVTNPAGSPTGTFPVVTFTTGGAGATNHTFDAGFSPSGTYSLGNRVWYDTNNDGVINGSEVGINNISVSLFADANADGVIDTPATAVATTTTAASGSFNGYYRFDNIAAGNYIVRVNPSAFADVGTLVGYRNTTGSNGTDLDSDAINNGENGIDRNTNALQNTTTGGVQSGTIVLGAGASEPVGETDVAASGQGAIDNLANMTVDFGFYRVGLNGTVWNDNNDDGLLAGGETGRSNVRVRIFDSSNAEVPVGPDGILGTSDDAANGMLTNASGDYNFRGLLPGNYTLRVIQPSGTRSSLNLAAAQDPNNNVNNDDNGAPGTGATAGIIVSPVVTLTPGFVGAANGNTVTNSNGRTNDPTVDFGLYATSTAVTLASFDSTVFDDGVMLEWQTGYEVSNLGFRIWRTRGGKRELVNKQIIVGSALTAGEKSELTAGNGYRLFDAQGNSGDVYTLEDVDINGKITAQDTAQKHFATGKNAPDVENSKSFDSLSRENGTQIEVFKVQNQQSKIQSPNLSANDAAIKIAVKSAGWQRVELAQLRAAGLPENAVSATLQLFDNGTEQAIRVNADGGLEFYGTASNTALDASHVYWLVWNNAQGKRIISTQIEGDIEAKNGSFAATVERRDNSIFVPSILNGERENFYGGVVSNQPESSTINLSNLVRKGAARLEVDLQGFTNNKHRVGVAVNGSTVGFAELNGRERGRYEIALEGGNLREGSNEITFTEQNGEGNITLLEAVRVEFAKKYQAENGSLRFTVPAGSAVAVGDFVNQNVRVFDVTDAANVSELLVKAEAVADKFAVKIPSANNERSFVALDATASLNAATAKFNQPSNWRGQSNGAEFVILSHGDFTGAANRLAEARRGQGLSTVVVNVEDIFDEYNNGERDQHSIRAFLANAVTNWQTKPKYLLIFGDANVDARNYLGGGLNDFVPTRFVATETMEAASDDSISDFDNDGIADIATGRLPVRTTQQAENLVTKLLNFENSKTQTLQDAGALFVADSGFEAGNAELGAMIQDRANVRHVNRNDGTTAEIRQRILDGINNGARIVNFSGHGSNQIWASNSLLRNTDAANLRNENQLGFFLNLTCYNGTFADPTLNSISESLLTAEHGGAFAVWASSGATFADNQQPMGAAFYAEAGSASNLRIGDLLRKAKSATGNLDVRRTWTLLGDPTMRLQR